MQKTGVTLTTPFLSNGALILYLPSFSKIEASKYGASPCCALTYIKRKPFERLLLLGNRIALFQ